MTIPILYLLSLIFFFLNIKILKIFSIFFCLVYLPGLILFALIKRKDLTFQDLVLAFPLSIGVISIVTPGLLIIGFGVGYVVLTLFVLSGLIILYYVIIQRKKNFVRIEITKQEFIFACILSIFTLILSIPVFSERIAITVHGFYHTSIVAQILNGIFPPENPGLGATRLSYQWGYHSLIAAISSQSDLQPLRVFSIINILSFFFTSCMIYQMAGYFNFSERYRYLLPLALMGLMRSDAGLYFLYNLLTGNLTLPIGSEITPSDIYLTWAHQASYLDSRLFFLSKFYNANPMPLGICLVFAYFLILLILTEKDHDNESIYLSSLFFILTGIAINYSIFILVVIFHLPLWVIFRFLLRKDDYRVRLKEEVGRIFLPCIIAAIITLPYLIYISSGGTMNVGKASTDPFILAMYKMQKIKNLMVFRLSLPFIIAGIWVALKRYLGFSQRMFFILSGALICLLLADLLRLPWYDSYKFIFILSLFFSILFVFFLQWVFSFIHNSWFKNFLFVSVVFILLLTPIMTEIAYIVSPWFKDDTYTFSGRHIIFKEAKDKNDAYIWLRDNTPKDSLILLPYLAVSYPYWDIVAHNYTYRVSALAERSYFVIKDVFAWTSQGYEERVKMRKYIFNDPDNPELIKYLKDLNRDIYILVEDTREEDYLKDVIFDEIPHSNDKIFKLVFNNKKQKIYHLIY